MKNNNFISTVKKKRLKIGVIGLGYVGLPLAIEFSKKYLTVGFDKNKNRLGMGGGFYDKTLSFHLKRKNYRVPKLFGLAFDCQEVDLLESKPWDVPVDGIVTPTRFIR